MMFRCYFCLFVAEKLIFVKEHPLSLLFVDSVDKRFGFFSCKMMYRMNFFKKSQKKKGKKDIAVQIRSAVQGMFFFCGVARTSRK